MKKIVLRLALLQLDCSGGIGLSEISPDYFISAGVSFRFNAFNKTWKTKASQKKMIAGKKKSK